MTATPAPMPSNGHVHNWVPVDIRYVSMPYGERETTGDFRNYIMVPFVDYACTCGALASKEGHLALPGEGP